MSANRHQRRAAAKQADREYAAKMKASYLEPLNILFRVFKPGCAPETVDFFDLSPRFTLTVCNRSDELLELPNPARPHDEWLRLSAGSSFAFDGDRYTPATLVNFLVSAQMSLDPVLIVVNRIIHENLVPFDDLAVYFYEPYKTTEADLDDPTTRPIVRRMELNAKKERYLLNPFDPAIAGRAEREARAYENASTAAH
jgi:hypothetical protein